MNRPSRGNLAGVNGAIDGGRPAATCPREPEVLRAALAGRWPDGAEEELRAHAASCDACASLGRVACALRADREGMRSRMRIPAAGTVFWRAELRARQEAARNAARPVPLVVVVGLAASAGLAFALVGSGGSWLRAWASWLLDLGPSVTLPPPIASTLHAYVIAAIALAAGLILVPLAVFLAARDD